MLRMSDIQEALANIPAANFKISHKIVYINIICEIGTPGYRDRLRKTRAVLNQADIPFEFVEDFKDLIELESVA